MIFRSPIVTRIPAPGARQGWIWSASPGSLLAPFSQQDWPNPLTRIDSRDLRSWLVNLLQTTLAPVVATATPFFIPAWPNPSGNVLRQDTIVGQNLLATTLAPTTAVLGYSKRKGRGLT